MHDLVEQAKQEEAATQAFGCAAQPYRPDQAMSDLLASLAGCGKTPLDRRG